MALTEGKGSLATCAAVVEHCPTLMILGHRGICICHYASDRAILSSVGRLLKQHHTLKASEFAAPELGRDSGAL
eukprot:6389984-Alexandrium_andersonii.AAC.1